MLITNQYSVYFGPLQFNQVYLVQFSPFGSLRSISVHSVYFNQFRLIQSNWSITSNSVQFGPFCPIRSIRSIQSTQVYSVHLIYFRSLHSNSMYLLKNGKIQVWVEGTINYLSNINCNYMISFSYHNNLLKRMRI